MANRTLKQIEFNLRESLRRHKRGLNEAVNTAPAKPQKKYSASSYDPTPAPEFHPAVVAKNKVVAERLRGLDPAFAVELKRVLDDYYRATGKTVMVNDAERTPEEQKRYYDNWVAGKSKYPAAKELSAHAGYAVDFRPSDSNDILNFVTDQQRKGVDYGLESGHGYGDEVHWNLKGWQDLADAKKAAEKNKPKTPTAVQPDSQTAQQPSTTPSKKSAADLATGMGVSRAGELGPRIKQPEITPRSEREVSLTNRDKQPTQSELEKTRKIAGTEPLYDPFTGVPTSKEALKAKFDKMAQADKASATPSKQPSVSSKAPDWKSIYDLNKDIIGKNPSLIKPGQKLKLPNSDSTYEVMPGDSLTSIAKKTGNTPTAVKPPEPPKQAVTPVTPTPAAAPVVTPSVASTPALSTPPVDQSTKLAAADTKSDSRDEKTLPPVEVVANREYDEPDPIPVAPEPPPPPDNRSWIQKYWNPAMDALKKEPRSTAAQRGTVTQFEESINKELTDILKLSGIKKD